MATFQGVLGNESSCAAKQYQCHLQLEYFCPSLNISGAAGIKLEAFCLVISSMSSTAV